MNMTSATEKIRHGKYQKLYDKMSGNQELKKDLGECPICRAKAYTYLRDAGMFRCLKCGYKLAYRPRR
jgi:ribosomal protein L37AE/L43A